MFGEDFSRYSKVNGRVASVPYSLGVVRKEDMRAAEGWYTMGK
ncbi:hypothetical protein [Agriterribacter sp.]|nr:hypothetical protein [Agriterribacter sp.]HRO47665.1 hypothetical protein [Agriterribacter sp.]